MKLTVEVKVHCSVITCNAVARVDSPVSLGLIVDTPLPAGWFHAHPQASTDNRAGAMCPQCAQRYS